MTTITQVRPDQLESMIGQFGVVIDVRTQQEHARQRLIRPHVLMPVDSLDPQNLLAKCALTLDTPLFCLCQSGMRAAKAAEKFVGAGCSHVFIIEGGIKACVTQELALTGTAVPGSAQYVPQGPALNIERQVRIAAGALVVLGTFLGLTVSHWFIWLALFVGCGLIFAGVTNWCGMALLLMKAPWNASTSCTSGSCAVGGKSSPQGGCS